MNSVVRSWKTRLVYAYDCIYINIVDLIISGLIILMYRVNIIVYNLCSVFSFSYGS